jgi:peptidylprolyl isomerase
VPHRLRHLGGRPAAAVIAVLLLPALASCGSSSKKADDPGTGGLSAVSFTGEVGKSLTAKWKSKVTTPKKSTATTLVKGKGDEVATGDTVTTYLWIGNGTTKKEAYSDYTNGAAESLPNNGQLGDVFGRLFEDATYGSRVATVTTAAELVGSDSGLSQLGINADDNLVVVADLVEKAATSPKPSDAKVHDAPASRLPKVVLKKGKPSGLDWTGIAKPSPTTPVQRVVLKQGKGPKVKASDTVTVNYLGETYKASKPFDESYSKEPLTQALSGLVQGWGIGLTGVKVGSRVLLQIPPAYGYGAQGSGDAIPANATLWFVIDVVKVK